VFRWLKANLPEPVRDSVDWVARRGETPGWDIQYRDESGELIAVEVKASTLSKFTTLEVTSNEWEAAQTKGNHYRLALVTNAGSPEQRLGFMKRPVMVVQPAVSETDQGPSTLLRGHP